MFYICGLFWNRGVVSLSYVLRVRFVAMEPCAETPKWVGEFPGYPNFGILMPQCSESSPDHFPKVESPPADKSTWPS